MRADDVVTLTGLAKSTIYRLMSNRQFPAAVKSVRARFAGELTKFKHGSANAAGPPTRRRHRPPRLGFRLATLVNAVSEEQSDNADAPAVIRNIKQWADGLHKTAKDLLLATVGAKSSFTIAMIQWINGATDILLALSKSAGMPQSDD